MQRHLKNILRFGALALLIALTANAEAAGLLKPVNSQLPHLQIKEHHVDVNINSGYVTTEVEQVFHNPNSQELEAIYSFPVPEHAAVGEFTYWIDGQAITGEVVEKQKAREIYQQQKHAGNEVALVEKDEYKTFDITVFPVRANSDVRIKLTYIQAAHVDSSIGRYVYPLEEGGVDEAKVAFWSRNNVVKEHFSFEVHLKSGYPVDSVRLPKHPNALIQRTDAQNWTINLSNQMQADKETVAQGQGQGLAAELNKDIVVYWRLQDGLPGAVDLLTYREPGATQGTFMLTLTPGDDLQAISEGRDWFFVLDVSGSMAGKYATLVEGVRQGLSQLNPQDRFSVIVFNNNAQDLSRGLLTATAENVSHMTQIMENYNPNGSTNLYAGLERSIKQMDADRASAIILVTDGVANVGVTEKKTFIKLMESNDVRLFTFIMGNSANRPLLEEMTDVSNGFAVSVSNSDDVIGKILEATSKMTHSALRDIELKIDGVKAKELTREKLGSVYRGEQIIVMGHYFQPGNATIELRGRVGTENRRYVTEVAIPDHDTKHPELERLWAYASIEHLQAKLDYFGKDPDTEQAITDLAKHYGLVTDYTSMLVVRDEVFDQLNIDRNNKKRVEKEQLARDQRDQQSAQNTQADQHQPMFTQPRPTLSGGNGSGSGGGASEWWSILGLMSLLLLNIKRKNIG